MKRQPAPALPDLDATRVGPDDVLLIVLPERYDQEMAEALAAELAAVGLTGRALVIRADITLSVVPRDTLPTTASKA